MASSWGSSWGNSWGSSWGAIQEETRSGGGGTAPFSRREPKRLRRDLDIRDMVDITTILLHSNIFEE